MSKQRTYNVVSKKQSETDEEQSQILEEQNRNPFWAFVNKSPFIIPIMVIIIGVVAYAMYKPTLDYKLVFCDDNIFLLDYKDFNKPTFNQDSTINTDTLYSKVKQSFGRTFGTSYYRPMLGISFLLDAHMSKDYEKDPENTEKVVSVFHRTNIWLHVIGSVFVFGLLVSIGYRRLDSFIFGMLFTLHPMLTPAASWISGRNDSLLAMFVAIAFVCMVQIYNFDFKTGLSSAIKVALYLLFALFFTLSLYTKEVIVFYPFVFLAYVVFFRKENPFNFAVRGKLKENLKDSWILALIMAVIGMHWYFGTRASAIAGIENPDTIGWDAFIKNYPTLPAMIGKIFLPIKSIALSSFEPFSIICGVLITLIIIYAVINISNASRSRILFGLSWFLFFMIPTLFIRIAFVDDFFDYAEHRAYLPIIGIFLIIIEILKSLNVNFTRIGALVAAFLVMLIFGYKSSTYRETFDGRKLFWGHMVELYPDKSRGYLDLGKAYLVKGEFQEAERLYKRGIVLNPNNKNLYIDLGVLYMQVGKIEESIEHSKQAIQIDPQDAMANFNLGWAYNEKGQYKESIPYLNTAVNRLGNPHWAVKLLSSLYYVGQYNDAYSLATRLMPILGPNPSVYMFAGLSKFEMGDPNAGEQLISQAINAAPQSVEPYVNLINLYIRTNQKAKIGQVYSLGLKNGVNYPPQILNQLKQTGAI